jgi:fumarate reductase flavoprotein subunit
MTDAILPTEGRAFEMEVAVVVVGGGGTGLCAALAAADAGAEVLVIERDRSLLGSTAMSTGLIPAAGTPEQAAAGIEDSAEIFAADILKKTKGRTDPDIAIGIARESAATIAWMRDDHGVPLQLIDGFLYPGHSAMRMYGTPHRTGGELMAALESAAEAAGIPILTEAAVESLFADSDEMVRGVRLRRPDGSHDDIGCKALILACSGFGGAADMVADLIPEMDGATYHGHPGNRGDAIRWGSALGAGMADLMAYQGHGGLAVGHGIPILWPLIMNGGFQVNLAGQRFSNEAAGYSEQAARINAQPDRIAWSIFDEERHQMMLAFEDYRDALRAGAVVEAGDLVDLAAVTKLPLAALEQTLAGVRRCVEGRESDPFGRDFSGHPPLEPPYRAARVTGALFHTQGGLCIDMAARVLRQDGSPLPNLLAGGGAARGISGDAAEGYMAGNGLLTATTFGRLAGETAAKIVAV